MNVSPLPLLDPGLHGEWNREIDGLLIPKLSRLDVRSVTYERHGDFRFSRIGRS